MTPPEWLRQLPMPTQRITARSKEWSSSGKPKWVAGVAGRQAGPSRSCPSTGFGWTILPGFIRLPGSKSAFSSPNAVTSRSPNMRVSSSPRDWPSPCSPERDPP
ncbi:hypothetical protein GCM10017687_01080 [Streptomyces echinatus]